MSFSRQNAISNLIRDLDIVGVLLTVYLLPKRRRTCHRFGDNPINHNRKIQGYYQNLVNEKRLDDSKTFVNFHRMPHAVFDELLAIVGPSVQRLDVGERSITASQRLSLTLRYLPSGESMISIGRFSYRVGQITTSKISRETCTKLWEVLKDTVFPKPTSMMWKAIATNFEEQWNFPHCPEAMDGKHLIITFGNSGSTHYNYKLSHSVVLFAIADANYKFTMVEIGASGHIGDSTIFRTCRFGRDVISGGGAFNLPLPGTLRDNKEYPYVFVGDEAFPLLPNLMRSDPGRNTTVLPLEKNVFNYRLFLARRVAENAFGILGSRWRKYRRPILATNITVLAIIKATVVLHNYIMHIWLSGKKIREYMSADLVDSHVGGIYWPGRWRDEDSIGILGVQRVGSNNAARSAVLCIQKH